MSAAIIAAGIAYAVERELKVGQTMIVEVLVKPEVKRFRPGMKLNELEIRFKMLDTTNVKVTTIWKNLQSENAAPSTYTQAAALNQTRHLLRERLSKSTLVNFKQHDPFFRIEVESDSTT